MNIVITSILTANPHLKMMKKETKKSLKVYLIILGGIVVAFALLILALLFLIWEATTV